MRPIHFRLRFFGLQMKFRMLELPQRYAFCDVNNMEGDNVTAENLQSTYRKIRKLHPESTIRNMTDFYTRREERNVFVAVILSAIMRGKINILQNFQVKKEKK